MKTYETTRRDKTQLQIILFTFKTLVANSNYFLHNYTFKIKTHYR